jgi:type I restriction enzyme, S subunit
MTNTPDNLLDGLPIGWASDRLKDVVGLRNEKTSEPSAQDDYLELEDIESGTGRILNRRNTLEVESAVTLFKKGDVLFGKLRPYLEKYYQADFDGKCTGEILAFRPERILSRFLFYNIGSHWFIERCNALAYGAKMPRVSWEKQLSQFNVPLPPLPEQKRIVDFLDASCATLDAAVAAKRRQIETLSVLRNSTISLTVTRGTANTPALRMTGNEWVPEVPEGWSVVNLKRISEIQTGLTLGKEYDGALIERPYLRVANVQDGYLDLADVTTIRLPAKVASRVQLCTGDVLMTEGGDLDKLGRGYLWEGQIEKCLHQNHIFAVRCLPHKLLPKFLTYVTAAQYGREYFEATGKRTTNLACTNATKVGEFPIPLPPVKEQERLVEFLDTRLNQMQGAQDVLEAQIETLKGYRKSLIHECVTGKRRITEADLKQVKAHG